MTSSLLGSIATAAKPCIARSIDCSIAPKPIASLGDLVMVVRCALILGPDGLVDHRRHELNSQEPEVHGLRPRIPSGPSGGDSFHPGWVVRTSPWCLAW